ncbi:hypothetical protein [Streptomyces sp. NPDC059850]|uniref:hypothetical protein n=1 Tax=Streptomyces sp. NPDC059850 TaxID=3346970 RepID=UPI00366258B0
MPRSALVAARRPRTHLTGTGPSAAGPALCRASSRAWLTRRRVVDFGLTGAMRCR